MGLHKNIKYLFAIPIFHETKTIEFIKLNQHFFFKCKTKTIIFLTIISMK